MSREVSASKFKAECLGLLDEVAATGAELVITKRHRPVAKVVPVSQPESLIGTVTYSREEDLVGPESEAWEAES